MIRQRGTGKDLSSGADEAISECGGIYDSADQQISFFHGFSEFYGDGSSRDAQCFDLSVDGSDQIGRTLRVNDFGVFFSFMYFDLYDGSFEVNIDEGKSVNVKN